MIKYALKCADGHAFESWFRDSAAFDAVKAAGQVLCVVCGSAEVEKTLMAPAVSGTRKAAAEAPAAETEAAPLSQPASPAEAALRKLREHLQKNSDYVGRDFAAEARRIHEGEADHRSIWGEATREEAKALHEEGVPVAPIPWMSRRDD